MKIFISSNSVWNLLNFRSNLIKVLILSGHEVFAIAPYDNNVIDLEKLGCIHISLRIDSRGINPINDIISFFTYIKIFYLYRPDLYLGFTIKPNIYGSLVAKIFNIPFINNITGLGTAFISSSSFINSFVCFLYKISLSGSRCIFFQNNDDRNLFIQNRIIINNNTNIKVIPGSGIDLDYFRPKDINYNNNSFTFLFVGRLIKDKGIFEFIDASRLIKLEYTNVNFYLVGKLNETNNSSITSDVVNKWVQDGLVEYLGYFDDIRNIISNSDCVVLPSYREGTPRCLLEACAMARPIIATNVPGCRSVVDDGRNGFLCNPFDSVDLFDKMKKMLNLNRKFRLQMGLNGRIKMEKEFNEKFVLNEYLYFINQINYE